MTDREMGQHDELSEAALLARAEARVQRETDMIATRWRRQAAARQQVAVSRARRDAWFPGVGSSQSSDSWGRVPPLVQWSAGQQQATLMETQEDTPQAEPPVVMPTVAPRAQEARAVREWLEVAWRHGEVVVDADEVLSLAPSPPVDRFRVAQPPVVH